ncbi:unnamed protein product [Linum tenue]|uniref:PIN-like protein n=1 Tax=Linum tenue TaxID=586396 RepID=A0AAV0QJ99_9ROSI|nr:unnamed protein product [Linum tenue]
MTRGWPVFHLNLWRFAESPLFQQSGSPLNIPVNWISGKWTVEEFLSLSLAASSLPFRRSTVFSSSMAAITTFAAVRATSIWMTSSPRRERSPQFPAFSPAPRKSLFSGLLLVPAPVSRTVTTLAVERSDAGNYDGSRTEQQASIFERISSFSERLLNFAASNFLPLALITAVACGMVNPAPGCYAHKYSLSKFATFGIFFIAGMKLKGEEIAAVAEAWPVGLFGLASILLLGPLVSTLILQMQLAPQEFATGMAVN